LSRSGARARPLGDHRLHSRFAVEPHGDAGRCDSGEPESIGRGAMTPNFLPSDALTRDLKKWIRSALAFGILLFAICIVGAFFSPGDFYHSYLVAFLFFT